MAHYISSLTYEPGFPACWEGLDLASADEATPRLYAVSYGNGNDGVSHRFFDFYCRTADPYALARLAAVTNVTSEFQCWASEFVQVDGEAEYTISAVLFDPPDDEKETEEYDVSDWKCAVANDDTLLGYEEWKEAKEEAAEHDTSSWSDDNGAWLIAEVWRVTEEPPRGPWDKPIYDDLEACFGADAVKMYSDD